MKQKFNVTGMTCTACSAHVEKAVAKVPGVHSVNMNLMANSMLVDYDSAAADPAALIRAVEEAGYGALFPARPPLPPPAPARRPPEIPWPANCGI